MKISACPALLVIAACCHGLAAEAGETAPRSQGEAMLATGAEAASRAFEAAQFRKDLGTLDRMLSREYVFVHGSGKVGDRHDFLAAFSDPAEIFTAFDIVNRHVILVGRDGAIVAAEATVRGVRNGTPFTQHFRYDDTYVHAQGAWEVVYTQVTVMAP